MNDDDALRPAARADEGKPAKPGRQRRSGPTTATLRRQARELALQVLFEVDMTEHNADEILARMRALDDLPPVTFDYLARLVRGVLANIASIDGYIGTAAPAFPVSQLASVDRSLLRLAVFELTTPESVPPKAAINEAVELAKQFGGDNSTRFVNGVLGTIHRKLEAERAGATSPDAVDDAC